MPNLDLLIRADDQASAVIANVQQSLLKAAQAAKAQSASMAGYGNEISDAHKKALGAANANSTASNSAFNLISARSAAAAANIRAVAAASIQATGATQALGIAAASTWVSMLGPLGLVVAAVAALTKGVGEVAQGQDALRRLGAAFTATGQSVAVSTRQAEEWAAKLSTITGIADNELLNALSGVVRKVGDVQTSMRVASLATDLAAASGGSFSEISNTLALALSGNSRGLQMLKRDYKDLLGGVTDTGQALTILEKKFGGTAEKSDGLSVETKKLTNNLSNMAKDLGNIVTPALTSLLKKMVELTKTSTEAQVLDQTTLKSTGAKVDDLGKKIANLKLQVERAGSSEGRVLNKEALESDIKRLEHAIELLQKKAEAEKKGGKPFEGGLTDEQKREQEQRRKEMADDEVKTKDEVNAELRRLEDERIAMLDKTEANQRLVLERRHTAEKEAIDKRIKTEELTFDQVDDLVTAEEARHKQALDNLGREYDATYQSIKAAGNAASAALASGFAKAFGDIVFEGKSMHDALKGIFKSIARIALEEFLRVQIAKQLALAGPWGVGAALGIGLLAGGGFAHGTQRIPGPTGAPRLALVHGGETVTPAGSSPGSNRSEPQVETQAVPVMDTGREGQKTNTPAVPAVNMKGGGQSGGNMNVSLVFPNARLSRADAVEFAGILTDLLRNGNDAARTLASEVVIANDRNDGRAS